MVIAGARALMPHIGDDVRLQGNALRALRDDALSPDFSQIFAAQIDPPAELRQTDVGRWRGGCDRVRARRASRLLIGRSSIAFWVLCHLAQLPKSSRSAALELFRRAAPALNFETPTHRAVFQIFPSRQVAMASRTAASIQALTGRGRS